MARFDTDTIKRWERMASDWLIAHTSTSIDVANVLTGRDAWTVAARCGITAEAYRDDKVTDGHIQTALERIFPNAVFQDKKLY